MKSFKKSNLETENISMKTHLKALTKVSFKKCQIPYELTISK